MWASLRPTITQDPCDSGDSTASRWRMNPLSSTAFAQSRRLPRWTTTPAPSNAVSKGVSDGARVVWTDGEFYPHGPAPLRPVPDNEFQGLIEIGVVVDATMMVSIIG
jgi:hypothetical protein